MSILTTTTTGGGGRRRLVNLISADTDEKCLALGCFLVGRMLRGANYIQILLYKQTVGAFSAKPDDSMH